MTKAKNKQAEIEGYDQTRKYPAVHKAMEDYVQARDTRMEFTKDEREKKIALIKAMHKAKISEFRSGDRVAYLDHGEETVRVSKAAKD